MQAIPNVSQAKNIYDTSKQRELAGILLEDLNDYGTLALPTMRRIVSVEKIKDEKIRIKEFKNILGDLGGINYLDKVKELIKDTKKEIIIAVENQ